VRHGRFFTTLLGLLVIAGGFRGEAQILDRGEISGTIRAETGAPLSGVTVTFHELKTGFARTTQTGVAGQYSGALLPLGEYLIRATLANFSPATSNPITLRVGDALVVDLVMRVAGVTEVVEVSGDARNTAPTLGTTMAGSEILNLPINGRDYRDVALLSPTAQSTLGTRGTFRVSGQPGDYLALNVDGADFTNNFFGEFFGSIETRNFTIPLEAVQEFAVVSGGLEAQSGRSNGGLVNVVTKSGSNERQGSIVYSLRHHNLTARDAFGNPPTGLVRHSVGGSVGGPLVTNQTFYFVATDVQRQTTPLTVRFARNVSGVAVPELGIADLSGLQGQYPRHENTTAVLAKVDHQLTANNRFSVRTNASRNDGDNIAGGSVILSRAVSNLESFHNQGISTVASVGSAIGPRLFLESKIHVSVETRPRSPQGAGPQVQIVDTATLGGSTVLPSTQDMYRYQVSESVAYVRGEHSLKIGGDYNGFNMRNNFFAPALNGAYVFPTLEAFVQRLPSIYMQNFGLNGHTASDAALLDSFWQHEAAAYFQDRFQATSRLSVALGVRFDAQLNPRLQAGIAGAKVPVGRPVTRNNQVHLTYDSVPQRIPNSSNQWGPRADVTYDLTGLGSTLVKSSAGLYYGRTPMIYFPLRGSGTTNTTIVAPPSRLGVTFPNVLPSTVTPDSELATLIGPPSIQYVDPGFRNPRVLQLTASVTRSLARRVSLEAGYLFSESHNLRVGGFRSTTWDRNLAAPTEFDRFGRGIKVLQAGRPDPAILQANALGSFGRGRYQALLLTARKAFGARWEGYANYVLSKNLGNASTERDTEALFGPSDPFDLETDFGVNELDERHRFKSYLHLALPRDITLASTWSAGSGVAFPVYSPIDWNGDGVANSGLQPDRPVVDGTLLPRFPYHQPAYFTWDFRVAKQFQIPGGGRAQAILDVFNIMNLANTFADARTQAVLGSPNFRVNNLTLGPRLAQLGLRIDF
jgi:hypothetical protein